MDDKKAELFRCAKELFSTKGFKDTNIADITKMAGVSVGTFYNYYPSKEKLFMEIFLQENVELKKSMGAHIDPNENPIEMVKHMLALNIAGIRANPILSQWYNKDVYSRLERLYREENGQDATNFLYNDTELLVHQWQQNGMIRRDLDSKLIMAIFAALINIDTHKDEVGLEYFPQVMDYMAEFVMKGLTSNPE